MQIDGRMRIDLDDFAACAGATTATLLATQLTALDADTDLVTVSIGGNDIGWGSVVGACVLGGDLGCAGALTQTTEVIQNVLPSAGRDVRPDRGGRPDAHVVVTGYPRLFSPESMATTSMPPRRAAGDERRCRPPQLGDRRGRGDAGFQFVDVTSRFVGHGVNAPNRVLGVTDPGRFHPNLAGESTRRRSPHR